MRTCAAARCSLGLGAVALAASLALSAVGCRRTPPPVLFRGAEAGAIGAQPPVVPVAPSGPEAVPADAAPAARNEMVSAPVAGDGTSLALDGVTVAAPAGERFVQALPLDVDGDGDRDVAVVRAARGGEGAPAFLGVGFYRREPGGLVGGAVAGSDPAAPPDSPCTGAVIRAVSLHTVTATYQCAPRVGAALSDAGAGPPGIGAVHVVVALAPSPVARYRVQEQLPVPSGTLLDIGVSAADRDGDGRDDVLVAVGARRPGERPDHAARAQVVLLDRGSGYARDTTEPEASFARLAAAARGLASRHRAADAVAAVERIVRLRRALCAESGAARLRLGSDGGVSCAGSAGLRAAAEALARAYIAGGELPAAIALTRPDTASELGVVPIERINTDVRRAVYAPDGGVVGARAGPFVGQPLDAAALARASALVLAPPASPTTVTLRGPVGATVELASLAVTHNEGGTVADVLARSLDGARVLQGFYETCEGVVAALCPSAALECVGAPPQATEAPPGATLVRVTDLPSAEYAARCVRDAAGTPSLMRALDMRAVGFGREGLVVALRGRLYRVPPGGPGPGVPITAGMPLGGPFAPGSAASESGEYVVLPTAEGVFVRDATGRWTGWAPPAVAGRFRQMTDLTISNDGRVVVGLLGAQLWVFERNATAAAAPAAVR